MNIFSISFERIGLTKPEILDWFSSEDVKGGKNCEEYWMLKTDITPTSSHYEEDILKLRYFLEHARNNNYQIVQIIKNKNNA